MVAPPKAGTWSASACCTRSTMACDSATESVRSTVMCKSAWTLCPSQRARTSCTSWTPATCIGACSTSARMLGSIPSSIRRKTAFAASLTMKRIAMVISRPMSGSSIGHADGDADRADEHRQRGKTVDAGVLPVGDQRRRADLLADADAEDRYRLVADEADDRRRHDPPEMRDRLRVDELPDRLVASHAGREEDEPDDDHAGEVFGPAVAIGEAPVRPRRCKAKAIQSGIAVAASPKLWIVSASSAVEPESSTMTT